MVAAVEAGIAVGLLGRSSIHSGLVEVNEALDFGITPTSKLVTSSSKLKEGGAQDVMKAAIRAVFMVRA